MWFYRGELFIKFISRILGTGAVSAFELNCLVAVCFYVTVQVLDKFEKPGGVCSAV